MLASMNVAIIWHWWLLALGLLFGNPFFKLVRYKNGIAVLFFSLLVLQDWVVASQALFVFLVLACARRRLNDLELVERDIKLVTERSSPRNHRVRILTKPLQAAQTVRSDTKKPLYRVRLLLFVGYTILDLLFRAVGHAILDLLFHANATPANDRPTIDPNCPHDFFIFFSDWHYSSATDGWDTSYTSIENSSCSLFNTNSAIGLPN